MALRLIVLAFLVCSLTGTAAAERKLNNLVSELLDVSSISGARHAFKFKRASDGWIFVSTVSKGSGSLRLSLDQKSFISPEAMRFVVKGEHTIEVECEGDMRLE